VLVKVRNVAFSSARHCEPVSPCFFLTFDLAKQARRVYFVHKKGRSKARAGFLKVNAYSLGLAQSLG